ncbi:MAG: DUF29 domain-containing protein [Myxococcales bacterium]|nr:DUF29 domain-containing protein [Myxococcales bacterium]
MIPSYEEDFHGWAIGTAELLRQRRLSDLDFDNLIEEIESMGRSERHQLVNRLAVLIAHLLKWKFQPDFRGRSWHGTIKEQRLRLKEIIEDNPSLKSMKEESIKRSYNLSCSIIEKETPIDLNLLSKECPYTFEECLDDDFYPE